MLYGFIITPTQWWHHHDTSLTSFSATDSKEQSNASLETERGTNCKICSHHYSCHNNDVPDILPAVKEEFTITFCNPTCRISLPFLGNPAERGPPSIG
ncbi:MAG: hypothetical protein IM552_04590 [Chitinophagaceae bacterium]|nr:hypothetical protein [Chitinophagaceae bacterium]MCE2973885.1 hypothetical protein [Sediminibacterium sp.]